MLGKESLSKKTLFIAGDATLVHANCGSQNVWAVDSRGQVYLRIGVRPIAYQGLSPAWVPVEGSTSTLGAKFTQVYSGSNDWMVGIPWSCTDRTELANYRWKKKQNQLAW